MAMNATIYYVYSCTLVTLKYWQTLWF